MNTTCRYPRAVPPRHPRPAATSSRTVPVQRGGSTLTEVLVALMVASIGLVSVATLFPMSVLRSVKATQVTSAADASYNAQTALDRYPDIIKHPDARQPSNIPGRPSPAPNYAFDPQFNNTTAVDPPWTVMQLQGTKNFIFDPLGFAAVQNLNLTLGNNPTLYLNRPEHFFGNDPSGGNLPPWPSDPPGAPWWSLPRYPLHWRAAPGIVGNAAFAVADSLVTLPDSWSLQYETIGGTLGGTNPAKMTEITLPNYQLSTSVLGGAQTPALPYPAVRVVLFSADGSLAQTRQITSFSTNAGSTTLQWTEDLNNNNTLDNGEDVNFNGSLDTHYLPTSFTAQTLGKVRVEIQERRYSWLLTVRQNSQNSASIDVVVFFQRALENIGVDEVLYNTVFTQGSTRAVVTYPTALNATTGLALKPFMRRGGFVFDANNAFWYRITNVLDDNAGTAVLTLETPALASTGSPPYFPPRAMFPRGVIDVFPLGTRTVQ
ncbi:MAG: hypothetical protein JSS02_12450 [Planctomycetes bacterium]|nr:hypothetical protein [Planctomycetota bacterium]